MPAFPSYTLRPVTDLDYDFLFELHCLTMKASVMPIWGWDEVVQANYFKERWHTENRWIVEVGGADAGILELKKRSDQSNPKAYQLYKRLGFKILEEREERHVLSNGN